LVTRGTGLIGSHTVDASVGQGNQMVVVDNLSVVFLENFDTSVKFPKMSICDASLTKIPISLLSECISP